MTCCEQQLKDIRTIQDGIAMLDAQRAEVRGKLYAYEDEVDGILSTLAYLLASAGTVATQIASINDQLISARGALAAAETLAEQTEAEYDKIGTQIIQAVQLGLTQVINLLRPRLSAAFQAFLEASKARAAAEARVLALEAELEAVLGAAAEAGAIVLAGVLASLAAAQGFVSYYRSELAALDAKLGPLRQNLAAARDAYAACKQAAQHCARCNKCVNPGELQACQGCGGEFCDGCFSAFIEQQELLSGRAKAS